MKNPSLIIVFFLFASLNCVGQQTDTIKVKKKPAVAPSIIKDKPIQIGWLEKVPGIAVKIGNCNQGIVTIDSLLLNPNLLVHVGFGKTLEEGWVVDSAKVVIVSNDGMKGEVFEYKLIGAALSEEIITKIRSLKPKSVIVFAKIAVSNPLKSQKRLTSDIVYTIKRPGQ